MSESPVSSGPAGLPPPREPVLTALWDLIEVVARLRAPGGCPWDREQSLATIRPFTLEETYELLEAIDLNDTPGIVEELGDVLLQVILYAQIADDTGRFNLIPVVQGITEKLIRRHPHVFGEVAATTSAEVLRNWEQVKQQEKGRASAIEGVPLALPALARAVRLQSKAAKVGYEWPHREKLWAKLAEEVGELAAEIFPAGQPPLTDLEQSPPPVPAPELTAGQRDRAEAELGDVLFVVANMARRWGINPETALRRSNQKFTRRFQQIEQTFAEQGRALKDVSLADMEQVYAVIKQAETRPE